MASPAPLRPLPLSAKKERKWRRARAFHIPARHRARGERAETSRDLRRDFIVGAGERRRSLAAFLPAPPSWPRGASGAALQGVG